MSEFLNTDSLYALENISVKSVKKRITRELQLLPELCSSISIYIDEKNNLPVITVEDKGSKSYNIYSFTIDNTYPFRNPNIEINFIPYSEFLRINSIGFSNNLKKVKGIDCFCCNSITNYNNWRPTATMSYIIKEIRQYKKIRKDVINKIISDIIKKKYLNDDINLQSWLF